MVSDHDKIRERVIALCGMFTSDFDGEVLTAARKATALLLEQKLTWREFLERGLARAEKMRPPESPRHQRLANWLLEHCRGRLYPGELKFIQDMVGWRRSPSKKQMAWLLRIFAEHGGKED